MNIDEIIIIFDQHLDDVGWKVPFEDNTLQDQLEIVEEYLPDWDKQESSDRIHLALCRRIAGGN